MIILKNIEFGYSKGKPLFKDLNLSLECGNVYGLLGKNGTGKTTLIKIISGLVKPNSGTYTIQNKNTFNRDVSTLENIYYVPEEFLLPKLNLKEYVDVHASFYPKFNIDQFNEIAETFELPHNKKLNTLSFGQKKKFLLAFGKNNLHS